MMGRAFEPAPRLEELSIPEQSVLAWFRDAIVETADDQNGKPASPYGTLLLKTSTLIGDYAKSINRLKTRGLIWSLSSLVGHPPESHETFQLTDMGKRVVLTDPQLYRQTKTITFS